MYGLILELQLDCSHYKCEINTWDPWNCVASIASVQTTFPFSEGENTPIPSRGFLTCQKYIRPSNCRSGEANLLSLPPAWQSWNQAQLEEESNENWMPFLKVQQQYIPIHSNGHCFSVQNMLQTLSQDPREKYEILIIKKDTLNEQN